MAVLTVLRGPASQREYPIGSDRAVLGRDRNCDIRLQRQEVSRQHAALMRCADGYEITDCGSHNGTLLNGQRLRPRQPYPLNNRDLIQVGAFTFLFQDDAADVGSSGRSSGRDEELRTSEWVLPATDQNMVDRQCDRFESHWQTGHPPEIEDHLAPWQGPRHDALRRKLLQELVQIDIEYRWRHPAEPSVDDDTPEAKFDRSAVGGAVHDRPDPAHHRLPFRPLIEDYVNHYPEIECRGHQQTRLMATEYRVRQQWGDRPRYVEFRRRFPHADSNLESVLRGIALKLTPTIVTIRREKTVVFSRVFSKPLEMGRQKKGEPPAFERVTSDAADRIIIASAHDLTVSRAHLYLDIVAKNEFLVENRSKKMSLFLESGEELHPGKSRYLSVPLGIGVGKATVRVARP